MRLLSAREIDEVLRVLEDGGVIVFPTETSYGLGCDATNVQAVQRVIAIKARDPQKGLPTILPPDADPETFVVLSEAAKGLIKNHWPGPLNIVAQRKTKSPIVEACASNNEQSVRKSSSLVASDLARRLGRPLVATSANPSGIEAAYDANRALRLFADQQMKPDVIVDAGILPKNAASTTIRCTQDTIEVLRQGAIILDV